MEGFKPWAACIVGAAMGASAMMSSTSAMAQSAVYKAPPPVFSWTGFYGGVNVGYGFGAKQNESGHQIWYANLNSPNDQGLSPGGPAWDTSSNLTGVLGGVQLGYNFQANPWWVFGFVGDIQGSGLRSSLSASNATSALFYPQPVGGWPAWPVVGTAQTSQSVNWFGTIRGRVGVTPFSPNVLLYGTGGLAYGSVRQSITYTALYPAVPAWGFLGASASGNSSSDNVKVGWVLGGGLEWSPVGSRNWSFGLEYLYVDLGSTTMAINGTGFGVDGSSGRVVSAETTMHTRFQVGRVAINYHFN